MLEKKNILVVGVFVLSFSTSYLFYSRKRLHVEPVVIYSPPDYAIVRNLYENTDSRVPLKFQTLFQYYGRPFKGFFRKEKTIVILGNLWIPHSELFADCSSFCHVSSKQDDPSNADAYLFNAATRSRVLNTTKPVIMLHLEGLFPENEVRSRQFATHRASYDPYSDFPVTYTSIFGTSEEFVRKLLEQAPPIDGNSLNTISFQTGKCAANPVDSRSFYKNRGAFVWKWASRYSNFTSFGPCYTSPKLKGSHVGTYKAGVTFDKMLREHKFWLGFENNLSPWYVSEKFWNAYVHSTVLVYWGDSRARLFVPYKSYIDIRKEFDNHTDPVIPRLHKYFQYPQGKSPSPVTLSEEEEREKTEIESQLNTLHERLEFYLENLKQDKDRYNSFLSWKNRTIPWRVWRYFPLGWRNLGCRICEHLVLRDIENNATHPLRSEIPSQYWNSTLYAEFIRWTQSQDEAWLRRFP